MSLGGGEKEHTTTSGSQPSHLDQSSGGIILLQSSNNHQASITISAAQMKEPESRELAIISSHPIVIATNASQLQLQLKQQQHEPQEAAHSVDSSSLSSTLTDLPAYSSAAARPSASGNLATESPATPRASGQWTTIAASAAQTTALGVRQRMSLASDQLGHSLRQLYASASSIASHVDAVRPPSYHNIPGTVPYYHGRSSGPPPSYDDVINPYAPPPTYQSLFGQMREARKSSRGLLDLLRRLLIILISTLGCTILIGFMILIPFTMIIVGATYIDECRVEHIPAFLLIGGLVWASKNIIHCYAQCQQQESTASDSLDDFVAPNNNQQAHSGDSGPDQQQQQQQQYQANNGHLRGHRLKSSICESLLNCILFGWFIAGCVIVFRNYQPNFDDPTSVRYCHRTVYMYTLWLITSAIVIFSLFVGCICCLMVSSAIASRHQDIDLA